MCVFVDEMETDKIQIKVWISLKVKADLLIYIYILPLGVLSSNKEHHRHDTPSIVRRGCWDCRISPQCSLLVQSTMWAYFNVFCSRWGSIKAAWSLKMHPSQLGDEFGEFPHNIHYIHSIQDHGYSHTPHRCSACVFWWDKVFPH